MFLLIFEGNDFLEKSAREKEKKPITSVIGLKMQEAVHHYRHPITRISLSRSTFIQSARFKRDLGHGSGDKAMVLTIRGHNVGFSTGHMAMARRATCRPNADMGAALRSIKDRIECIFFIPTNYSGIL